jgi:uncharacterized protein with NRDE domain
MCLIVVAHRFSARFPLVIAANRDEEYARPTRPAHWWDDAPSVLGGRDVRHGGSWLALTRSGRIAAITNVRAMEKPDAPSRGQLVGDFVRAAVEPEKFASSLEPMASDYAGFHLVAGNLDGTFLHLSNVDNEVRVWTDGIHGLSNALPGAVWPKVERATAHVADLIEGHTDPSALAHALIAFLGTPGDASRERGSTLREEIEGEVFVMSERYGTRSSTAIVAIGGELLFAEQNYGSGGVREGGVTEFRFRVE